MSEDDDALYRMGKGNERILEVLKFTWKTSTMFFKVLIKSNYDNYLWYSESVDYILSLLSVLFHTWLLLTSSCLEFFYKSKISWRI